MFRNLELCKTESGRYGGQESSVIETWTYEFKKNECVLINLVFPGSFITRPVDKPCVVVASKTKETSLQAQCSVPGSLTRACTVVLKIDDLSFLILFLFLLLLLFATVWAYGPSPRLLKTALSFHRPSQQTMVGRFIVPIISSATCSPPFGPLALSSASGNSVFLPLYLLSQDVSVFP